MKGCYLICADRGLATGKHPRHYIGYSGNIADRILTHRCGKGSRLLQVFEENGIMWYVVRVWEGAPQSLERRLKRNGHFDRLCPNCQAAIAEYKRAYAEVRQK